jgi:methionyl-tRNA formyltransferase
VILLGNIEIRTFDDPVLRKRAKPVPRVNNSVKKTLDDMLDSMRAASGVGLAAPQVGVSKRLVVLDVGEGPYFLVNPEIVSESDEKEVQWEGCLSWPGFVGEVERPVRVLVKALDRDGRNTWIEGEGLLARALCHEIDHLDGIMFVDKAISITEIEEEENTEEGNEKELGLTCVFMGSPEFSLPSLDALIRAGISVPLVVTQPDRPYGRTGILMPTPVRKRATELGLKVITPEDMSCPDVVSAIKEVQPDVIAVVAFGQKLPKEVLEIPKYACLNVHPSLLPKYRGGNPIQRQLMAGETEVGVSIMYMDEGMDSGDICLQRVVPVGPDETLGTLEKRLSVVGADALLESIHAIYEGSAPRIAQDEKVKTVAFHLKPGEDVIDWTRPATEIHNLVRALSPAPGAVTTFGDERIKIWQTELADSNEKEDSDSAPGTIIGIEESKLLVRCGEGLLAVTEVQPEGKRRMSAKAFLAGRQKGPFRFGDLDK